MVKIFYHSADLDGFCSGAIIALHHRTEVFEFYPIDYKDDFPFYCINEDDIVYLVDFSLQPFNKMCQLADILKKGELYWIDHHISAIRDAFEYDFQKRPNVFTFLDDKRAACMLCWIHSFKPNAGDEVPRPVYYINNVDLGKANLSSDSSAFCFGLRSQGVDPRYNMDIWSQILLKTSDILLYDICQKGRTIISYEKEKYKQLLDFGSVQNFEGLHCVILNIRPSVVLKDLIWDRYTHIDAYICFYMINNKWVVTMFTEKDGIDLSKIAIRYGGGGHKKAAGFVCDTLPFKF